jgi:mediator of RNA polymerase II transcription subunit 17
MGILPCSLLGTDVLQVSRDGYPDDLPHGPEHLGARCDLIHASLQLLLVRAHARQKTRRWAASGSSGPQSTRAAPPPVLRPLLDIIQYETFCERVWTEVNQAARVLSSAAIHARARFSGLGDSSSSVLHMLSDVEDAGRIGGEAILRINHRYAAYQLRQL